MHILRHIKHSNTVNLCCRHLCNSRQSQYCARNPDTVKTRADRKLLAGVHILQLGPFVSSASQALCIRTTPVCQTIEARKKDVTMSC